MAKLVDTWKDKAKNTLSDLGSSLFSDVNIKTENELGEGTKKIIYLVLFVGFFWIVAKIFKWF